jgi:hypothetical protein
MATRFRIPSPISEGKRSANSCMCTSSRRRRASASASLAESPLCFRRGSATFSTQVIESKSVECWKTIAHFIRTGYIRRSSKPEISSPSSHISPLSQERRPTRCLMRTLFPTPDAPMMKNTSPGCTSNETSSRTALGPNALAMFRKRIMASSAS